MLLVYDVYLILFALHKLPVPVFLYADNIHLNSLPPEYFVVSISDYTIYERKEQSLCF